LSQRWNASPPNAPRWAHDAETAGSRPEDKPGGLRNFPIFGGRGFIQFLAVPRHECVYVCNIVWNG
jgi:hypothetical protein